MANQDSESHIKKFRAQNNEWAILGKGSISKLLYDLMILEGFKKSAFIGFLVTQIDKSNNYSLEVYSSDFDFISEYQSRMINQIKELPAIDIYCSIGYSKMNKSRRDAFENLKKFIPNGVIRSFISKDAYICEDVEIEEGCLILPKSIVEASVKIKKGTVLWFGSHICHHSFISEFCWIAAQTTIGAKCFIGERTFFGIGGIVPTGSKIARGTLITAGSISPQITKENQVIYRNTISKEKSFEDTSSEDFIRFL